MGEDDDASEQLGWGAVAGDAVWDPQARVRLRLGPLTRRQYDDFLPNGSAFEPLQTLTRFFSGDQLDFEVQLRAWRGTRCLPAPSAWMARGHRSAGARGCGHRRSPVTLTIRYSRSESEGAFMNLDLRALIGKLNHETKGAVEAAAGLCLSRTHYDVEVSTTS